MPVFLPQCFVEVYPIDGGQWYINGGKILNCIVRKSLKDPAGTFEIQLAPGGPQGANSGPTWLDIITPMSFTLIGMTHGSRQQIVMLGVTTRITEKEIWRQGKMVERAVVIEGMDFAKFFLMENWLAVTLLGGYPTSVMGGLFGTGAEGGLAALSPGLYFGSPDKIVQTWYNDIMLKVMAKTYITYKGSKIYFPNFMGTWFEKYTDANITLGEYYIPTETIWLEKFKDVMAFPWFEVFVVTSPTGIYSGASGGHAFSMNGITKSATPYLICRVNPLPYVPGTAGSGGSSAGTLGSIKMDKWNALPSFKADSSFIESTVTFTDEGVRNYFVIIPSFYMQLHGDSNNPNVTPVMYRTTAMADLGSIVRYGYRPMIASTKWFADPTGAAAQQNAGNSSGNDSTALQQVFANVVSKLAGYYEPVQLMGNLIATFPLLPDVMIGCRFSYNVGKGEPLWTSYIEAVEHDFTFGGPSFTTVSLSRALPNSIYQNNSLLKDIHTGNAARINGTWQSSAGQPQGLGFFSIDNLGALAAYTGANTAWHTAQQK